MKYKDIPKILTRYSLESKLMIAQKYSIKLIGHMKLRIIANMPHPWDLDAFIMFSIKAQEYQYKNLDGKNINKFIEIINLIRNYNYDDTLSSNNDQDLINNIFITLGSNQFGIQETYIFQLYRYNYFFNYVDNEIDMKKEFKNKFNCNYDEVLKFGFQLFHLFTVKGEIALSAINYIFYKNKNIIDLFTLNRKEYIEKINIFAKDIYDYKYCVKPSESYPFLKYDNKYFIPLPHNIIKAITSSLLYRITDKNNNIRTLIGKNVIEKYIYDLANESSTFDEVLPEKKYIKNKSEANTSDVMCRKKDYFIFFESKSMVPYYNTRCLNNQSIIKETKRIAKAVIELYTQIYIDFGKKYYDFEYKITINREQCYGIVVLLDESYILRDKIYYEVENIIGNKETIEWIKNHIKICTLYDLENCLLCDKDIIYSLDKQKDEKKTNDLVFSNLKEKTCTIKNIKCLNFRRKLKDDYKKFFQDLEKIK